MLKKIIEIIIRLIVNCKVMVVIFYVNVNNFGKWLNVIYVF